VPLPLLPSAYSGSSSASSPLTSVGAIGALAAVPALEAHQAERRAGDDHDAGGVQLVDDDGRSKTSRVFAPLLSSVGTPSS
jgi:hypothetical protein